MCDSAGGRSTSGSRQAATTAHPSGLHRPSTLVSAFDVRRRRGGEGLSLGTSDSNFYETEVIAMAIDIQRPAEQSTAGAARENLSAEIAEAVEREPGDRVRCTWVAGSSYRCNWWAPVSKTDYDNPGMDGPTVTTHRVRKSQFLTASKTYGRLVIRDHSRPEGSAVGRAAASTR